jgi:hypothetical protein
LSLEYAVRKPGKLNWIGTKWVADDVKLISENINVIRRNTKVVLDARKEVDLELNTEKTRYMFIYRHQITGQNNIEVANKCIENAASSYILA